jgi:methylglutaconyl-CoA hydratase
MTEKSVLIDSSDSAVTVITLNRPLKRNALSVQLLQELLAALQSVSRESARRALILNANGPVFCAGLDLKESADRDNRQKSAELLAAVYKTLVACPLVTIAAAQGAAIGGGVGLLSACDLAIATEDLQIGFPEVKRGLVAALVTALVRRQVNDRLLRELVLLGGTLSATRVLSIGLVNQVTNSPDLMTAARALAALAVQSAPLAVARSKQLLDELSPRPIAEELDRAMRYHIEGRDSEEAIEGINAFLEKRESRWPPMKGTDRSHST